jgi:hypothetical protein
MSRQFAVGIAWNENQEQATNRQSAILIHPKLQLGVNLDTDVGKPFQRFLVS